jgi:hypothetical protein
MLAIDTAGIYPKIQLLYTGFTIPGEICYNVYWLAMIDPCIADSPENLLSPLKRLILMRYTTKVILFWSHWEVYWLAFLCRRGAVFHCQARLGIPIFGSNFWDPHQKWNSDSFSYSGDSSHFFF